MPFYDSDSAKAELKSSLATLTESSGKEPNWNFWKYLVDVNGKVVNVWGPTTPVKEIRPLITDMVRQIILKKKVEL